MPTPPNLKLLNVRENNLKGLNLELPQDRFTAVTGLSGSGKSSLAFGTVYAEGQRRYIETFSSYTRQFFDKVKKPEVDLVENIRPATARHHDRNPDPEVRPRPRDPLHAVRSECHALRHSRPRGGLKQSAPFRHVGVSTLQQSLDAIPPGATSRSHENDAQRWRLQWPS